MRIRSLHAWQVFLTATALFMVGYMLMPENPKQYVFPAWTLLSFVVMIVGIRKNRPRPMTPFVLFAFGLLATGVGDIVWYAYPILLHRETPYPSLADAIYPIAFVLWGVAILLLVRGRKARDSAGGWIDTAIAITAFSLLEFALVIYPSLAAPGVPLFARAVSAFYPVADIVMLGLLARLVVSPGARVSTFYLVVFGFALMLCADGLYGVLSMNSTYNAGFIDLLWISAYGMFAASVLHPSVRTLAKPADLDVQRGVTNTHLGVLTVLALIAPALYAYTSGKALPVATAVAISVGSAVLFLLVIARLAGLVHALAASMNEVAQAQALRGELLRRTIRASESERTRLGIELHDGPVQGLTAVGYRLDALQRRATARSDRRDDKVQAAQDALSKQIATLRQMMTGLRPGSLVERGIEAMLRDYCASIFKGLEIGCRIHVSLSLRPAPEVEVMLCRVVEEAMANVVKHSCARHIDVSITDEDGEIHLLISDDGIGFVDDATAVAHVGLGVANMRERVEMAGGTFAIHGLSGAGVTIRAVIPKQMEREGAA